LQVELSCHYQVHASIIFELFRLWNVQKTCFRALKNKINMWDQSARKHVFRAFQPLKSWKNVFPCADDLCHVIMTKCTATWFLSYLASETLKKHVSVLSLTKCTQASILSCSGSETFKKHVSVLSLTQWTCETKVHASIIFELFRTWNVQKTCLRALSSSYDFRAPSEPTCTETCFLSFSGSQTFKKHVSVHSPIKWACETKVHASIIFELFRRWNVQKTCFRAHTDKLNLWDRSAPEHYFWPF
jgi:hypothetical protein